VVDVATDTRMRIIEATRSRLLADGYAGLSTRKVAEEAGVPLSQLHYHFGYKGGLIKRVFWATPPLHVPEVPMPPGW
jgi:AcrR family transcriptional regulator